MHTHRTTQITKAQTKRYTLYIRMGFTSDPWVHVFSSLLFFGFKAFTAPLDLGIVESQASLPPDKELLLLLWDQRRKNIFQSLV